MSAVQHDWCAIRPHPSKTIESTRSPICYSPVSLAFQARVTVASLVSISTTRRRLPFVGTFCTTSVQTLTRRARSLTIRLRSGLLSVLTSSTVAALGPIVIFLMSTSALVRVSVATSPSSVTARKASTATSNTYGNAPTLRSTGLVPRRVASFRTSSAPTGTASPRPRSLLPWTLARLLMLHHLSLWKPTPTLQRLTRLPPPLLAAASLGMSIFP